MRILIFSNSLDVGGSQTNAVDLALATRDRGHQVVVTGPAGPLVERVLAGGLTYVPTPERPRLRPSPAVMASLIETVDRHRIQIVHGYEWPPILEACYGPSARRGTAVVGTVMSMGVAPFIPKYVPLAVGTATIAEAERRRRTTVHLLEPPVDLAHDDYQRPFGSVRSTIGCRDDEVLVVVVSRLAAELKREGILAAVGAMGQLPDSAKMRLAIVGDGPVRDEVENAAREANDTAGRPVVHLVGEVLDPRAWYADADVALGMGGSALRSMAYARPLVVQGERGFWSLLTPDSLPTFLHQGWYGVGDGADGTPALVKILASLAGDPARRAELGSFARSVVVDRFSLERAAKVQEEIYRAALAERTRRRRVLPQLVAPAARVSLYEVHRRSSRLRGRFATDDFNAISRQPIMTNTGRRDV